MERRREEEDGLISGGAWPEMTGRIVDVERVICDGKVGHEFSRLSGRGSCVVNSLSW